jgi:glycosyltransferase involved in cell wall biosynthesis
MIYDAHNVESRLFREMTADARTWLDKITFAVDARRVARQERLVLESADAVVAVSAEDARELAGLAQLRRAPVVVPSSVPLPEIPVTPTGPPVVLFVGTLDFPPNVAAVTELVNGVLPRIRVRLPDTRLLVVGRRPTAAVRALAQGKDFVEVRADVEDVDPSYREARCTILPVRIAGGSRLKVYEALAYGLPVVGTAAALSGIELSEVAEGGETADQLAEAAIRILGDDSYAARLGAAGRSYFAEHLSWATSSGPLLALVAELALTHRPGDAHDE